MNGLNKNTLIGIFGSKAGATLFEWLDDCCEGICPAVNSCLGISPDANPTLVLNRQGNWIMNGGGGGIQSVTGLDTDNTDPLNPIVRISVDGTTVTGDGTPGNPLVSTGGGGGGPFLPLAGGTMDPGAQIFFGTGGQNIAQGSFDNGLGANNGISLYCTLDFELNWQGGHLSNYSGGYQPLTIDSPITLSPSTNFSTGWGNVQEIITSSGTEAGISLTNTSADGRQWNIISTGTGSDIPAGAFSIGDSSASANRFMIDSSGVVSIFNLAGGGSGFVGVDNTGALFFTTSPAPSGTPTQIAYFDETTGLLTSDPGFTRILSTNRTILSNDVLGGTQLTIDLDSGDGRLLLQNGTSVPGLFSEIDLNGTSLVLSDSSSSNNFRNITIDTNGITFNFTTAAVLSSYTFPISNAIGTLTNDGSGILSWVDNSGSSWLINGNSGTSGYIGTNDANDFFIKTNGLEAMRILASNQFVGIGTSAPTHIFEVVGTSGYSLLNTSALSFTSSIKSDDSVGELVLGDDSGTVSSRLHFGGGGSVNLSLTDSSNSVNLVYTQNLTNVTHTFTGGNVGIGTISPLATLEVDGTLLFNTGNQGLGKILTSDVSGNADWVNGPIRLKVSLSAVQIQIANSVPIDIGLPTPGAGFYYRVVAFDAKLTFGTVPFTSTALYIGPSTTASPITNQAVWGWENVVGSIFNAGTIISTSDGIVSNIVDNDTLSIVADSDSVVGDSTIDCYITVEKVAI